MRIGIVTDNLYSLRYIFLVLAVSFSLFETRSYAAFTIGRPSPANSSGNTSPDKYDTGVFTYKDKKVIVSCDQAGSTCSCTHGGTFIFIIENNGSLTPHCIYTFNSRPFGCQFHIGVNYVWAVDAPDSDRRFPEPVKYINNDINSILSIENTFYWNMTWHTIPTPIFGYGGKTLKWKKWGSELSQHRGHLLRVDLSVSLKHSSSTSGCLLIKIAGTRTYPLTPYTSKVTSQEVTSMPMSSAEVKSSLLHVPSTPIVIPSVIKTKSSPSRFVHRVTPTSSDIHDVSSLSSLITNALTSLPTFDMSMTPASSAIRLSHYRSMPLKSIVSTSQGSLYSSLSIQRPDTQTRKIAPSSAQGVMSDTTYLKASSGHLQTVGRSANFQSTKYFASILRSTDELPFQSRRSSLPPSSSTIAGGSGGDTSKQSGDNVPLIIGALFGGLFGVVAIVIGALLFRRKFCGGKNVTKGDQLQLPSSPERYHRNGSVAGTAMKSIDNGVYLEAIDLKFRTSSENKRPRHVYENGLCGTSQKIQPPDQVYSEIGVPEEPVYGEVDEPIYKEVAEEDGPIYKEVSEEDEPIYKEVAEEDGPIYKEVSEEDGPIFEEKDSKYQPLDEHVIENPNAYQFLHNESNPSRPQSPVYQIIDPAIAHSDK